MSQRDTIDTLTEIWGRVSVRDGFKDGHITISTPSGCEHTVNSEGVTTKIAVNHSIDWSE